MGAKHRCVERQSQVFLCFTCDNFLNPLLFNPVFDRSVCLTGVCTIRGKRLVEGLNSSVALEAGAGVI